MPQEELKAFWEAIQANTALQQKLQGITDLDAIVAIAEEAGFNISSDDLRKAQSQLTDASLEASAGGSCDCVASFFCLPY